MKHAADDSTNHHFVSHKVSQLRTKASCICGQMVEDNSGYPTQLAISACPFAQTHVQLFTLSVPALSHEQANTEFCNHRKHKSIMDQSQETKDQDRIVRTQKVYSKYHTLVSMLLI